MIYRKYRICNKFHSFNNISKIYIYSNAAANSETAKTFLAFKAYEYGGFLYFLQIFKKAHL